MLLDGRLEPHMIVVRIPGSVLSRLVNEYREEGQDEDTATRNARYLVRDTVLRYVGAGTPFAVVDEDTNLYPGLSINGWEDYHDNS